VYPWYAPDAAGDRGQLQEAPRKSSETRERILDVAEASVLEKGFAATSIEEVIAAVGITKSGFFYHFKDKNELAKALRMRCSRSLRPRRRAERRPTARLPRRSQNAVRVDELMADLPNGHAGCLVASYC